MKIYRTKLGVVLERAGKFYLVASDWDQFIDTDDLFARADEAASSRSPIAFGEELIVDQLLAPVQSQEVWASGVTYFNSKLAREQESKDAGGGDFYARVYVADRPELFFKSNGHRVVGPGGNVRIRKDSSWDVPEPELTLLINAKGRINGYTIGNDMSSRSIEGENPLYLPQAKMYDGSASIGPCVYVSENGLDPKTAIELSINRNGVQVFHGKTDIGQIKREFAELASWLYREMSFPNGCYLMTGTGIVPTPDFTLRSGDEIRVTIEPIGTLVNFVE